MARTNAVTKPRQMTAMVQDDIDRTADRDNGEDLLQAAREAEPVGAFHSRAIRDLYQYAPTHLNGLRGRIRRSEVCQVAPLADSTIYETALRRYLLGRRLSQATLRSPTRRNVAMNDVHDGDSLDATPSAVVLTRSDISNGSSRPHRGSDSSLQAHRGVDGCCHLPLPVAR